MKGIEKYKPVLVALRDQANAKFRDTDNGTPAQAKRLLEAMALQEAILLMDLVQDWAFGGGHQPAKRDRLMAFLKREVKP